MVTLVYSRSFLFFREYLYVSLCSKIFHSLHEFHGDNIYSAVCFYSLVTFFPTRLPVSHELYSFTSVALLPCDHPSNSSLPVIAPELVVCVILLVSCSLFGFLLLVSVTHQGFFFVLGCFSVPIFLVLMSFTPSPLPLSPPYD